MLRPAEHYRARRGSRLRPHAALAHHTLLAGGHELQVKDAVPRLHRRTLGIGRVELLGGELAQQLVHAASARR